MPFVLAGTCAFAALIVVAVSMRPWSSRSALDQFWSPVLDAPGSVLLSIGEPSVALNQNRDAGGSRASRTRTAAGSLDGAGNRDSAGDRDSAGSREADGSPAAASAEETISDHIRHVDHIVLPDATALVNISGFLGRAGKPYRLQGTSSTTLTDLRQGPAILISAFDNPWTLRLAEPLRFHFVRQPGSSICSIEDREDPSNNRWSLDFSAPYSKLTEDYAIVARFWDATTGQLLVIAAGISTHGTISAGEFLTDKRFLQEALDKVPGNLAHKNIEAVIITQVIDTKPGPPRIAALHVW